LVLRKIGKECGITRYGGTKRQWIVVVSDGLPYTLGLTVVKETKVCNVCHKSFLGDVELQQHFTKTHPSESVLFYHEFDWVILKSGGGHYEMNMVKSFFELNWVPFLSEYVKLFGFKTDRAQNYAKACKDYHKSWFMLLSFHIGSINELVLDYVRDCMKTGTTPTAEHFISVNKIGKSPNYLYLQEQVFTYSQSILNMRMGTRRNNVPLILAAKHKGKGLFHGRSHDKYQMIELYESLYYELFPTQLREFMNKCQSLSKSGDPSKGQDFDFILEEVNKVTKMWIPKGLPSERTWLKVCRNIDDLEMLRKTYQNMIGKYVESEGYRNPDLTAAVSAWRLHLRKSGFLSADGFCSISGEQLDEDLTKFTEIALSKRYHLINDVFLDVESDPVVRYPVFVTPAEREKHLDIRNKTKEEIGIEIERLIAFIHDAEIIRLYGTKYRAVKSKPKAKLLQLYYDVKTLTGEIASTQDMQDEMDEDDDTVVVN
jgi:hypothetical protein